MVYPVGYLSRYLYISEGGKHPKIIRTELDGGNAETISEHGVPSGLAVSGDQVHFAGVESATEADMSVKMLSYDTIDDTVRATAMIDEVNTHFSEYY